MRQQDIRTVPVADIELPVEVDRLFELAYNLWWSWNYRAIQLFSTIDPEHWQRYRNPVQVLINVDPQRWESLLSNEPFMAAYHRLVTDFDEYLEHADLAWFPSRYPDFRGGPVAYVSPEFGWHESLGIYSGGLGILAGDHCKSASDEGIPFVGVGLLYNRGYFRQTIDADGQQQHFYPNYDTSRLPVLPVVDRNGRALRVDVDLPGRSVHLKVWKAAVGRVAVLLLDSDIPENDPADRPITSILYVRGREMRLCQEMLLGVGAVKALDALGIQPSVWHMNEGHSALLVLQRLHALARRKGLDFDEAHRQVSARTVFTTHTPVPAGNEIFDAPLMERYLEAAFGAEAPVARMMELGRHDDDRFNFTALAIRCSSRVNGVSRLHGEVVQSMWAKLLEGHPTRQAPALHITNGVHVPSWLGPELRDLFARHLGSSFLGSLLDPGFAEAIASLPDDEIWAAHQAQKKRLLAFARRRVQEQLARHGRSPDRLREVHDLLHPDALTIGFARRFATYKRATLLFRESERLRAVMNQQDRPTQVLFAGKAHPADRPGQALIEEIFKASRSAEYQGRIVMLEDYDMMVGRMMVQGVDLWLNTPIRRLEASGTSGQKAAANGALNFSVADGWWVEGYDPSHGWLIGEDRDYEEGDSQDQAQADSIYRVLADEIVPCFYERDEEGLPHRWIARMKAALGSLTPRFSTSRMVRDYTETSYLAVATAEETREAASGAGH